MIRYAFAFLLAVALLPAQGSKGISGSAGGIKWSAASRWKSETPQSTMRAANYRVPAAAGDKEDGECAVFYFGAGQGGGVQANVDRWVAQFKNASKPKNGKQTINGLAVTTIDVAGTYMQQVGGPMSGKTTDKPDYRLLGAIAEGTQSNVFIKFTGPAKTVTAAEKEFDALVKSLKKE
jgi:hypothetical protein